MAKNRKILMLVENEAAPGDDRVWLEATTLRDQGFQVSIICPKGPPQHYESYICIEGIHIYRYGLPTISNKYVVYILEYSVAMLMTFLLSFKVLLRNGFDVIHAANPPDLFFLISLFYRLFGIKFVFDQHDLSPEMFQVKFKGSMKLLRKLLLFIEWCSYRTADVVITPNLALKRFAHERGHVPDEKIFVVYNGPDLNRTKLVPPEPELKGSRRYLLAYVGVMEVQDGVEYALYALHNLVYKRRRQDVSLVLMGHGSHAHTLHAITHELGLDEYVNFTGWLSKKDLVRYLTVADVGLTPDPLNGYNEYCTMVKTQEYMAMGKPGVAFDLLETRLSAQDAVLYATPNSVEDFASKIEVLLDDEALRLSMGALGHQRVEEALSWNHTKKNLLLAYEALFLSPQESPAKEKVMIQNTGQHE
jgi:glycosyltransferase involved in cell wall biosynthesis